MKHAPLRGLRCFPGESTGSTSGRCGWAFDMAILPGRSDVTRPVCADTGLAASMHRADHHPCCSSRPTQPASSPPLPVSPHSPPPPSRAARQPERVSSWPGQGIHQPCPNPRCVCLNGRQAGRPTWRRGFAAGAVHGCQLGPPDRPHPGRRIPIRVFSPSMLECCMVLTTRS
jgi:hypothetical protein